MYIDIRKEEMIRNVEDIDKKALCVHNDEHTVLETITRKSIRNSNRYCSNLKEKYRRFIKTSIFSLQIPPIWRN